MDELDVRDKHESEEDRALRVVCEPEVSELNACELQETKNRDRRHHDAHHHGPKKGPSDKLTFLASHSLPRTDRIVQRIDLSLRR